MIAIRIEHAKFVLKGIDAAAAVDKEYSVQLRAETPLFCATIE